MEIAVPDLEEFIVLDGECDKLRRAVESRDLAVFIVADEECDVMAISSTTAAQVQTLAGLPDYSVEGPRSFLDVCHFRWSLPTRVFSWSQLRSLEPRCVEVCLL